MVKTKLIQHLNEKISTESIKSFGNINLESYITITYFLRKHVSGFQSDTNTIFNVPTFHKTILIGTILTVMEAN